MDGTLELDVVPDPRRGGGGLDRVTRQTDPNVAQEPTLEILTSGTTGPAKLSPLTFQRIEERYINRNIAFAKDRPKDRTRR